MDNNGILDDILGQLGSFGRYQLFQHSLHGLAWFLAGIHMMSFVFVFPILEHRCHVKEFDNRDQLHDRIFHNFTNGTEFDNDIRLHIPLTPHGKLESCLKFGSYGSNSSEPTTCDSGYVYNSSYFLSSRIADWDMVCDKQWMRAVLQSVFLLGTLTGACVSGVLADKYGRKPVFCISGIIQCICGIAGAFLNNYILFAISMFWYGLFGASGCIVPSVALTMEIVGPTKRVLCGTLFTVWFGIGAVVVAAWAYFLPIEANKLQLIYALHSILLFGHYWLMDESICWLWTNGKRKEALKIAERAAKMNGKHFENRYSTPLSMSSISKPPSQQPATVTPESLDGNNPSKIKSFALLRYPKLRQRTLVMLYCWFAASLTYFGLSFNSVSLGNPFVMFLFNILVEIPAHLITIFGVSKTGNKPMFSTSLLITGISCVVVPSLPIGIVTTTITMIAKVTATLAFNVINSYTAELFPTNLRNTAIGICVMAARSGAAIIPEINLLSAASEEIPTITFGTAGILAGLFTIFLLPETMNKKIPQTIEDVENEKSTKEENEDESKSNCILLICW